MENTQLIDQNGLSDKEYFSIEHLAKERTSRDVVILNNKTKPILKNILSKTDFGMRDALHICQTFSQKTEPCATHYILVEVNDDGDTYWYSYFRIRYGIYDSIKLKELTGNARLYRIEEGCNPIEKEFVYDPIICFQIKSNSDPNTPLLYCRTY